MSRPSEWGEKPVQAHLNFLAIYNPSLGKTEETQADQVLFYYSGSKVGKHRQRENKNRKSGDLDESEADAELENEKLRQVGLAQGIVTFGRSFSDGQPVRAVETEKHRIVMGELEDGWWILSSINLTRNLRYVKPEKRADSKQDEVVVEYSSRDVSPPELLKQQLFRAHRIFALHHGPSLKDLYTRSSREKFCNLLDRYWTPFAKSWDIRLHGNPSADIYDGIKLASGGELGMGVGEEEWGSGEREVLEGIVHNTDGLVDMTVHRYGHDPQCKSTVAQGEGSKIWGTDEQACDSGDGMLFSGIGTLSRTALRNVSDWIQLMYLHGEGTYGVKDNPTTSGRRRRHKKVRESDLLQETRGREKSSVQDKDEAEISEGKAETNSNQLVIPPPIVSATNDAHKETKKKTKPKIISRGSKSSETKAVTPVSWNDSEYWSYLKFGYGSTWGPGSRKEQNESGQITAEDPANSNDVANGSGAAEESKEPDAKTSGNFSGKQPNSDARFIIGLLGNLAAEDGRQDGTGDETEGGQGHESSELQSRISLRTLHVELSTPTPADSFDTRQTRRNNIQSQNIRMRRLRVVVFMHPPFIFTLLFEVETSSLSMPSFFRTLRSHFIPLHKPLLLSTSPSNVSSRLQSTLYPFVSESHSTEPIYHLIYDPRTLSIQSSLPNIPYPGTLAAEGLSAPSTSTKPDVPQWTRVEVLSAHTHILQTYLETRRAYDAMAKERYAKTSRGCSIFWLRTAALSDSTPQDSRDNANDSIATQTERSMTMKQVEVENQLEAFLVRRAGDPLGKGRSGQASAERDSSGGFARASAPFAKLSAKMGGGEGGENKSSWAGSRLVDGIGVDPRRYIESILSLNR